MLNFKFLIIFVTVFLYTFSCLAMDPKKSGVSLSLNNESVREMTESIFEQTGYTVLFPDNFYSMKVSGEFKDISIEELLTRVMKGVSHSVLFKKDEALIIVQVFGGLMDIDQDSGKIGAASPKSRDNYYDELVTIAEKNEKEFQAYIENPLSLDPRSGLSFGEIKQRAAINEQALQGFTQENRNIDPSTGYSIGQVKENLKINEDQLQAYISSAESVDPGTGRSVRELREIALKNQARLDQNPPLLDF